MWKAEFGRNGNIPGKRCSVRICFSPRSVDRTVSLYYMINNGTVFQFFFLKVVWGLQSMGLKNENKHTDDCARQSTQYFVFISSKN